MSTDMRVEKALAVLGLRPGASLKDCHQAWKQLSRRHHPDTKIPGSEEQKQALEIQRQLNDAYDLLKKADLTKYPALDNGSCCTEKNTLPADSQYQHARDLEKKGDVLQAMRMYEHLAAMGNAGAQFRLGYLYSDSVMKDLDLTLYWWKRAADQGHVLAQYNLALMYERGLGVELDLQLALHWFGEAAKGGDLKANERMRVLRSTFICTQEKGQVPARTSSTSASMCGPLSERTGRAFIGTKDSNCAPPRQAGGSVSSRRSRI